MLKKFVVRNYKNFRNEIVINFDDVAGYQYNLDCLSGKLIGKALIYGKNATGKTNLGNALIDIANMLRGIYFYAEDSAFLNADSKDESAYFLYTFLFDHDELTYEYSKVTRKELLSEKLIINGKVIFSCNFKDHQFSFDGLRFIKAETLDYNLYTSSLFSENDPSDDLEMTRPFLRWLISNAAIEKESIVRKLSNYVSRMLLIGNNVYRYRAPIRVSKFPEILETTGGLKHFEQFLNAMGIECTLVIKKLPDDQYVLYFSHEQLVPFFENASSGTLMAASLYQRLFFGREPSFIFMDEFDAFYHYEMSCNIVKYLKNYYPNTQIILTSHNTNLISNKLARPDCIFVLSSKGMLTSLHNATERELREGHNLEKMYISGEFSDYE